MATNNTVQYTITAKDQASAVFAQVATKAKGVGAGIAESFAVVGAAAFKMRGTVSDGFAVMTGNYQKLGSLLGALPGPIGVVGEAVGSAIGGMLQKTIDMTVALDKLSQKTGGSIKFLSGFTEAADDMRISAGTVESALGIFSRKIGGIEDPLDGSGQSAGAFAKQLKDLGITTDNMEEALFQVADIFEKMPNGVEKAALSVQLFGKQGGELIPILNKGREGIKGMMGESEKLGKVIDQDLRDKVIKLKEAQDQLDDTWGGAQIRIASGLIPALGGLTGGLNDYLREIGKANEQTPIWALQMAKVGSELLPKLAGQVGDLANKKLSPLNSALQDFGGALYNAATKGGGLSASVGGVGKAFGEVLQPTSQALKVMGDWSAAAGDIAGRIASSVGPIKDYASAMTTTATPTNNLKDAASGVNGALGLMPEKLDAAKYAVLLYKLSVGDVALASWEADRATRAVGEALTDKKITGPQAVAMWKEIKDGLTPIPDIMARLGSNGETAMKEIGKVETALGRMKPTDVTLTFDAQRTQNFIDATGRYSATTDKTVNVTVAGTTSESFGSAKTSYDSMSDKSVTVSINYSSNDPYAEMEGRARGGPVKKGKPYTVGEQGPEMFVPYTSGYIVPNNAPYTDPGTKVSQSFNVNNPSVIINSVNGAAIAQQIARGNANVVRRARTKASFMG